MKRQTAPEDKDAIPTEEPTSPDFVQWTRKPRRRSDFVQSQVVQPVSLPQVTDEFYEKDTVYNFRRWRCRTTMLEETMRLTGESAEDHQKQRLKLDKQRLFVSAVWKNQKPLARHLENEDKVFGVEWMLINKKETTTQLMETACAHSGVAGISGDAVAHTNEHKNKTGKQ